MPGRSAARTVIRGKGWKKQSTIAADKFDAVARAILASLGATPIRFTELVERVATRLPDFDGSVSWYTITVVRELEVRGMVVRHTRPVLYAQARQARLPRKRGSRPGPK